ncbi:putative metal-dependent HD superfamily phosphohydrolase [Mumia flava]|uniref:Putative metal-dependent HD superfamily phosphohydrolase n=1 Tax=Mumia flava TaxID=1348852 RepID=A0A0B2BU67_9ACTN|nr:hypothetical protein [Mumia flava]PJJ56995.1 putative metal-dependent HD superfamily phosphohydrolase [Mumia flava]
MHPLLRFELGKRWAEPHRAHHGMDHLIEVLRAVDVLAGDGVQFDHELVEDAAWFHDAIYDVHRADSVERSADLAQRMLDAPQGDEVARLVLATRDHLPARLDEAVLCDADLWVLGADHDRYDAYARDIRAENSHLPEASYKRIRARVLTRYLTRGGIFSTEPARLRWEQAACDNLVRELSVLGVPVPV